MIAPLYKPEFFSYEISLVIAVAIGFGFGFFLERGGLGNAKKLAMQFYFKDMAVFKVMFSAIITAGLGLYYFTKIGFLDISLVSINPTYIYPQLIGGLIFGMGFVIGGLCPGTSCVSIATGKIDGLALLTGIFLGIFLFAETSFLFTDFFNSGYLGSLTIPELLNISDGIIILVLVIVAIFGFSGAAYLEKNTNDIDEKTGLKEKYFNRRTATAALFISMLAAISGNSVKLIDYPDWDYKTSAEGKADYVSTPELAEKIIKKEKGYLIVDLRELDDFNKYHIPGAVHFSEVNFNENSDLSMVLCSYATDSFEDFQSLNRKNNLVIFGGIEQWKETILFPDLNRMRVDEKLGNKIIKISRYFGGKPILKKGSPENKRKGNFRDGC